MRPLISGWLGLPPDTAKAFVMSIIRRDFGAAGFFTVHLTDPQLLVAMVTITLFVPCLASTLVVLKERGWAYMLGLFVGSMSLAFLLGGIIAHILRIA
jgi:ferrous iron transport protein B